MSDDLISRQAAIEACLNGWNYDMETIKHIQDNISRLPSVQSKAGHWICDYKGDHVADYHCSECGRQLGFAFSTQNKKILGGRWKYCDVCGAKMKGETE